MEILEAKRHCQPFSKMRLAWRLEAA